MSACSGVDRRVVLVVLGLITIIVVRRRIRIELIRSRHLSHIQILIRAAPVGASTVAVNVKSVDTHPTPTKQPSTTAPAPAQSSCVSPPAMLAGVIREACRQHIRDLDIRCRVRTRIGHRHRERHTVTDIRCRIRHHLRQRQIRDLSAQPRRCPHRPRTDHHHRCPASNPDRTDPKPSPQPHSDTHQRHPVGASTVAENVRSTLAPDADVAIVHESVGAPESS